MLNPRVLLILALLATATVQASTRQSFVVIENVTGTSLEQKGRVISFYTSQVVTALETKGQSVLVQDEFRFKAWLPRTALADVSSFRPITAWHGESKFEVSSASGDSGQTYSFKPDGTFRAKFDDNHKPRKWSGQLYRNGQIIWAKPKQNSAGFDYWGVFRQVPGGKLCVLHFDTPLGCECVGTYNSAFTTSCK